jgi:hypothetical protein
MLWTEIFNCINPNFLSPPNVEIIYENVFVQMEEIA